MARERRLHSVTIAWSSSSLRAPRKTAMVVRFYFVGQLNVLAAERWIEGDRERKREGPKERE